MSHSRCSERRRARDLRDRLALAASFGKSATAGVDTLTQGSLSVSEIQRALPDNQTALVMMNAGEGRRARNGVCADPTRFDGAPIANSRCNSTARSSLGGVIGVGTRRKRGITRVGRIT